jgi:hypothetical protein
MPHKTSSKSTTDLRFEGQNGCQATGMRNTAKGTQQDHRRGFNQFYTPSRGLRCPVAILAPDKGRIYDPGSCTARILPVAEEPFRFKSIRLRVLARESIGDPFQLVDAGFRCAPEWTIPMLQLTK